MSAPDEPLRFSCPCAFCDGEAHETEDGELLPCEFCSTVCIPHATRIGRWYDLTRWRLHLYARGAEDDGADPTIFVPEIIAGRYDHACRLQVECFQLDEGFARALDQDDDERA